VALSSFIRTKCRASSSCYKSTTWRDVVRDVLIHAVHSEAMTGPGIVNLLCMFLFLCLALAFVLPPVFEVAYRIVRQIVEWLWQVNGADIQAGPPARQVLLIYGFFMLPCVGLLVYATGDPRRR
jgi:hypothetical protein